MTNHCITYLLSLNKFELISSEDGKETIRTLYIYLATISVLKINNNNESIIFK